MDVKKNMVLDKYVTINERQIISGQDKDKLWFCKEFPAETTKEVKEIITELNRIYNEANKEITDQKSKVDTKSSKTNKKIDTASP